LEDVALGAVHERRYDASPFVADDASEASRSPEARLVQQMMSG